jgi:hypothetical protein
VSGRESVVACKVKSAFISSEVDVELQGFARKLDLPAHVVFCFVCCFCLACAYICTTRKERERERERLELLIAIASKDGKAVLCMTSSIFPPNKNGFLFLTALHVYANYKGVVALQLYSLNTQRAALLVEDFLLHDTPKSSSSLPPSSPRLLTPSQVKTRERIYQPLWSWLRAQQPLMGCRISDLSLPSSSHLSHLLTRVYPREKYLLAFSPCTGRVLVVFLAGASPQDELKAFFQAQALRFLYPDLTPRKVREEAGREGGREGGKWPSPVLMKAVLKSYELTVHRFPVFWEALGEGGREGGGEEGWELGRVNLGTRGWRLVSGEEKEQKKKK